MKRSSNYLIVLGVAILLSGVIILAKSETGPSTSKAYDKNISETSEDIFNNTDALYSYVKKFGPQKAMAQLNSLSGKFGSCHNIAHKAGRFAYEIYKEESFKECSAECHSGCYHGATEAYFKENGTTNLSENLRTLCSTDLNAFFSHQCLHGIGHGLMAWTNYELPEALTSCELLNPGQEQYSCWTGVFMENIVGGLESEASAEDKEDLAGHFTKYLSEDPHYPCNAVEDKYKSSCYLLQTSRMLQLYSDFSKVSNACENAPDGYERICFESMGRDIGGNFNNPEAEIQACQNAPRGNYRTGCLVGAVQDSFWDEGGQNIAIKFCTLLNDSEEKTACYNTIINRAPQVISYKPSLEAFCNKLETSFRSSCLSSVN